MKILKRSLKMLATVVVGSAMVAGCASADTAEPNEPAATSSAPVEQTLIVFAAASLTNSFTEIGEQFEAENPGVTVEFNFAGSSDLVAQITEGAPADVFASADENNMTKATDADLVADTPQIFVRNTLAIVTPPANPADIASAADLEKDGLQLVVCAAQVPCGAATETFADQAGLTLSPVSEENAVTDVLGKVTSGQADAGIVYVTDAVGAGQDVNTIEIADDVNVTNSYPIALLGESENAELAEQFISFVVTGAGQDVLQAAGFLAP